MLLSTEISDSFTKKRMEFTEKFLNKNLFSKRIFSDDCQFKRKLDSKKLSDLKNLRRQSYSLDDEKMKISNLISINVDTLQVIKVYITDYEFKYFSVDENTNSADLVNAALVEFDLEEYKDQK